MKYYCKKCERVLTEDAEMYQISESQTLECWGKPIKETVKSNHCCYCDSDNVDCLNTDETVYTVTHKVGNVLITSRPFYSEDDAKKEVDFLAQVNRKGNIKEW